MHRLANYDVAHGQDEKHSLPVQIAFGVLCAAIGIAVRLGLDFWAPMAGPFSIVYPTVLIATLYGHASGGLTAYVLSFGWAWWYVLPVKQSFEFEPGSNSAQVIAVNAVCVLIVLVLAEGFRRAVRMAFVARDTEIQRRGVLMTELEHRTKNNFALVASLLSLQARNQDDPAVTAALQQASSRITTFAQAYASLAFTEGGDSRMPMQNYIREVVSRISASIISDEVTIEVEAGECVLPQQVAVAIGLFLNEALTNCAKYAFPEGRAGRIRVTFSGNDKGWELSVVDDGMGVADPGGATPSGLGQNLMRAFAQQAEAQYEYRISPEGCQVSLTSQRECLGAQPFVRAPEFSPA